MATTSWAWCLGEFDYLSIRGETENEYALYLLVGDATWVKTATTRGGEKVDCAGMMREMVEHDREGFSRESCVCTRAGNDQCQLSYFHILLSAHGEYRPEKMDNFSHRISPGLKVALTSTRATILKATLRPFLAGGAPATAGAYPIGPWQRFIEPGPT